MQLLYHYRILARDGMQVHVAELISALERHGHTVTVVGPEAGGEENAGRSLTDWLADLRARLPTWLTELMELAYSVPAYARLRARARAVPPQAIYERYNLFLLSGVWLKRALGVPLLLEVNAPLAHERAHYGQLALKPLARWAERYVWRRADLVLPVSDALADHVRAAGVPESRIAVIPNGVRAEAYVPDGRGAELRARLGTGDRVVFGFVGFVRPWHGLDRVLDAFARLDVPAHLLIVGDGPARPGIEARAAALGLADRVTVTGAVPHAEVPGYLQAFDVALQPDVTPYASPLKLVEYMAAGCAILAPNRPNIREIVQDGETAVLFDPDAGDPDDPQARGFTAAVLRLAGSAGLRRTLGAAAAAAVQRDGRTWDANAVRVADFARTLALDAGRTVEASTHVAAAGAERAPGRVE
jgi:glycosyltransferase involved in cell wall biosynthesis